MHRPRNSARTSLLQLAGRTMISSASLLMERSWNERKLLCRGTYFNDHYGARGDGVRAFQKRTFGDAEHRGFVLVDAHDVEIRLGQTALDKVATVVNGLLLVGDIDEHNADGTIGSF